MTPSHLLPTTSSSPAWLPDLSAALPGPSAFTQAVSWVAQGVPCPQPVIAHAIGYTEQPATDPTIPSNLISGLVDSYNQGQLTNGAIQLLAQFNDETQYIFLQEWQTNIALQEQFNTWNDTERTSYLNTLLNSVAAANQNFLDEWNRAVGNWLTGQPSL